MIDEVLSLHYFEKLFISDAHSRLLITFTRQESDVLILV